MFLGQKKKLEDCILEELSKGPLLILDLIQKIKSRVPGVTKQGVYYALRVLKSQEVVVLHKGHVSINVSWLNKVNEYTLTAQHHYFSAQQRSGDVAALQDGEKIKYYFTDPSTTDIFWNHTITILSRIVDPVHPFIAFDPHCWFFIAGDNESTLRDSVNKDGRSYLVAVNGNTLLDKHIKNEFNGTESQYYMAGKKLFPSENYYLNIIGDYIVEVWLDTECEKRMQHLYSSTKKYSDSVQYELQSIIEERGKTKLVVSRNIKKAERLKKKLLKFFFVPTN